VYRDLSLLIPYIITKCVAILVKSLVKSKWWCGRVGHPMHLTGRPEVIGFIFIFPCKSVYIYKIDQLLALLLYFLIYIIYNISHIIFKKNI